MFTTGQLKELTLLFFFEIVQVLSLANYTRNKSFVQKGPYDCIFISRGIFHLIKWDTSGTPRLKMALVSS